MLWVKATALTNRFNFACIAKIVFYKGRAINTHGNKNPIELLVFNLSYF
jgi:hypothetical protein